MHVEIKELNRMQMIGASISMNMWQIHEKTPVLWRSFMPKNKLIENRISHDLYSVQFYPEKFHDKFSMQNEFIKWAAVPISDINPTIEGLKCFDIPSGLYAVFTHRGPVSKGALSFQYIHMEWLPKSAYLLDNRPHFERLYCTLDMEDENWEEEIWIPIQKK